MSSPQAAHGGAPKARYGGGQPPDKQELGTAKPTLPAQPEPRAAGKFFGSSPQAAHGGAPKARYGGGQPPDKQELGTAKPTLPAQPEPRAAGKFFGSGRDRAWTAAERTVLVLLILLVVVTGVRLALRAPVKSPPAPVPEAPAITPMSPDAASAVCTPVAAAAPAVPTRLSPAGKALLTRIRACPPEEIQGVVDAVSPLEALSLYHQLTPADRQEAIAALPAPVIARKVEELLGIPQGRFAQAGDVGPLVTSLVEIALGGTAAATTSPPQTVCFATAIDTQGGPERSRTLFRVDERRIYACLDAGSLSRSEAGVLVRWNEELSGALVCLDYLPLVAGRRWNHVYYQVADAWTPGSYRVSCFRLGTTIELLYEGTYRVGKPDP